MNSVAALVNRGFRRVERAAEAAIGKVGPFFVAIYIVLVGTGVWLFCTCQELIQLFVFSRLWCLSHPLFRHSYQLDRLHTSSLGFLWRC